MLFHLCGFGCLFARGELGWDVMLVHSDLARVLLIEGEVKGCWSGWLLEVSCWNLLLRSVVSICGKILVIEVSFMILETPVSHSRLVSKVV